MLVAAAAAQVSIQLNFVFDLFSFFSFSQLNASCGNLQ
jgi:hypothetical protein